MDCAYCQQPIQGTPVTDLGDPMCRVWCSVECRDASGEAWMEQHYRPR